MKKISVVLPVLAPSPFLRAMTEFCIKTMRMHADNPFDLIVCEAQDQYFDPSIHPEFNAVNGSWALQKIDKYLHFNPKIGGVREYNAGVRAAETEFVVCGGNDVIVPPHWDTALLDVFAERPRDCAIASLSAMEPGSIIGPGQ